MNLEKLHPVKRIPRIVTLRMRNVRGGFFEGFDRRGKHYVVNCVPAHAKKTDSDILQQNGVCLPINARQQRAMVAAPELTETK